LLLSHLSRLYAMEHVLGFLGRLCGLASVGSLFTTVEEGVGVLLVLLFSKDCVVASVRAEELVEGIGRDGFLVAVLATLHTNNLRDFIVLGSIVMEVSFC